MKRWLLAVLLILGVASAQKAEDVIKAQCAKAPVVAELWHAFRGGAPRAALENLVVEFNKRHQGEFCIRPINQGGYRDLSTKIKAAFAAGKLPTLAQAYENQIALYLEANAVTPVQALGVDLSGLNPTFVNAVRFKGLVYGVPFNKSVQVLYYNRDLLRKYGVAAPPKTLDAFIALAKKLSRAEGNPVYWFRPDTSTFGYWFFTLGGAYMKNGKLVVNSPEAKKALRLMVQSVQEGWGKAITSGYINQNFGKGTYGFSTDSSAGYKYYLKAAKFDLGLATLPGQSPDRPGYGVVQGTDLIVFKAASDAQKKAAAAFLNFVITPEVQAIFSAATGYVPVNPKAVGQPELEDRLMEDPNLNAILKQANYAKYEPQIPQWEQIRFDILGQAITQAVLGKAGVDEALDHAQALVDKLLSGQIR